MSNSCPFHFGKSNSEFINITDWYKRIKKLWLRLCSLTSFVLLLVLSRQVFNETLSVTTAAAVFILGVVVLGILTVLMYCSDVRKRFFAIDKMSTKKIPVQGFFKTLYEVLLRPKTLLRDIDLERKDEYGDIYLMFTGFRPAVVVTTSELVEKISKDYDTFNKSDPRELNMPFFHEWVGGNNVVLANGEEWQRMRKFIHSAVNMTHLFVPVFQEKARELNKAISAKVQSEKGSNVELTRWLKAVSLDSSGQVLFGYNFNHLQEESNPGIDAMDSIINEIFNPTRVAFPIKNKLPIPSNQRLRHCMKVLDELVNDMIDYIKKNPTDLTNNQRNVLEILINGEETKSLSKNELRNNIIALVLASHETTQVSLGAALYYLAKFPEHQERLRKESLELFHDLDHEFIENYDPSKKRDKSLAYKKLDDFASMENFILESIRLYSPLANQNPRTTTVDTELGGYHIPKGSLVIMNIHAVHMCDAEWNDPKAFDPDRFFKGTYSNNYAFLPFGSGPRLCSGRNFSLIEQKIVLCNLLKNYKIELPHHDYKVPMLRGSFTGVPRDSFQLKFTRIDRARLCTFSG